MAQFNGTVEQLNQSVAQTEATADFIIDSGTESFETSNTINAGVWHYQIYKSGFKKCWTTFKCVNSITLTDPFAGGYAESVNVIPPYPSKISFIEYPLVNVNMVYSATGTQWKRFSTAANTNDINTPPQITILGHTQRTYNSPVFSVVVEGY